MSMGFIFIQFNKFYYILANHSCQVLKARVIRKVSFYGVLKFGLKNTVKKYSQENLVR